MKKIVSVARLHEQKPIVVNRCLCFHTEKNPEYKLYIGGEGAERPNLENHIKELGIEKSVFLLGTTEDVFMELYDTSVFVLSSDFEGMPNALIEAMELRVPCVSTDCPCGGTERTDREWEKWSACSGK